MQKAKQKPDGAAPPMLALKQITNRLDATSFRSDEKLVSRMSTIWNDPVFQAALVVLFNHRPHKRPDISAEEMNGLRTGYEEAWGLLQSLTVPVQKSVDIPMWDPNATNTGFDAEEFERQINQELKE